MAAATGEQGGEDLFIAGAGVADQDEDNVIPIIQAPPEILSDFQFVGLYGSSNGRRCDRHQCCGQHIQIGDLVRMKKTVVTITDHHKVETVEEAIKVVKIEDGVEACTVGFIPRTQMMIPKVLVSIEKCCIVAEIYNISANRYKRMTANKIFGMAGMNLVDAIPHGE
jgi:hypothetical protein